MWGASLTMFSVVLPVRNGWPYVKECVDSILTQTYRDLELIVLDNQSTDNTIPWLKTLSDKRIRLHSSSAPLSIVESWARVKDVEKRRFMTVIGHDDKFDPGFLEAINRLIEQHGDAGLYQTGARLINSQGKTRRSCRPIPKRETAAQYLEARFTFKRDVSGTGLVMRSTDYDRLGGIPPYEKLLFADDALWLSLLSGTYKAADPVERVGVRIHNASESASLPTAWSSLLKGLNQFSDFLQGYIETDHEARAVNTELGPQFMLAYHRNIYIYALVEACQKNRKISPKVKQEIEQSLARCAPPAAGKLHGSSRVAAIHGLNSSPLRGLVPHLWNAYSRIKS